MGSPHSVGEEKDGSFQLCVDYRKLNSVSWVDAYPMPRMDELIDNVGQARFMTTLELTRGYWQVPMAEESHAQHSQQGLFCTSFM